MKRHLLNLIIITTVLLMHACKQDAPQPEASIVEEITEDDNGTTITKQQFESSGYELGSIMMHDFKKIVKVPGTIHIPQKSKAIVSSFIDGTAGRVNLVEGEWVKKGQVLFTLTNPSLVELQESFLLNTEELSYSEKELVRIQELFDEKLATIHQLNEVKSAIVKFKSKQASIKKRLQLYGVDPMRVSNDALTTAVQVYAPISGYIEHIHVLNGMYLQTAQKAVEIMSTSHKYLELTVLEKDIATISKGQKIRFSLQGNPSEHYTASVHLINPIAEDDHTIKVKCHLDKDSKSLMPGIFVSGEIVIDNYNTYAIPKESIVSVGSNSYGLKLISDKGGSLSFEKVNLETGLQDDEYIEVKNETNMSNKYLTKGAYYLINE